MNHGFSMSEALELLGRNPEFRAARTIEAPKAVLAANVALIRHARNLTRQELADTAGIRQSRLIAIERGEANPTLETLARIADALGVSIEVLLADRDCPNHGEHQSEPALRPRDPHLQ